MLGFARGLFWVNSGTGWRMDVAARTIPGCAADGSLTMTQLAAELGVPESQLAGCVAGSVALREVVQVCGYKRRTAQGIVDELQVNGTNTLSPHGLPWARLEAITAALDDRRRADGRRHRLK